MQVVHFSFYILTDDRVCVCQWSKTWQTELGMVKQITITYMKHMYSIVTIDGRSTYVLRLSCS